MSAEVMQLLLEKAKKSPKRVVLPEPEEEKVLLAARKVLDLGIAFPVLIGNRESITALAVEKGIPVDGFTFMDHTDEAKCEQLINGFLESNQEFTVSTLKRKMRNPLYFGAMLVKQGEADCLAAGISHTTGEVILASKMIIGLKEGISTVSSLGILEVPGFAGSEGNLVAISDCAVCPRPDSSELADIAISSADTVSCLLGWEPRVAMLSFSTKGSSQHEEVEKVAKAVELVRERRPGLLVDGELQLDAALIPVAAAKKVPGGSPVAGKANIIIFPDLAAGNIGVKLVQLFAKASAPGPLLQGFAKPVTDFSRSAPVDEIVGNIAMLVVTAQRV